MIDAGIGRFKGSFGFRALSIAVLSILLAIFLVSKIPSTGCHCRDPIKSKKELCPFGALRALTFVEIDIDSLRSIFAIGLLALAIFRSVNLESIFTVLDSRSRGPPTDHSNFY